MQKPKYLDAVLRRVVFEIRFRGAYSPGALWGGKREGRREQLHNGCEVYDVKAYFGNCASYPLVFGRSNMYADNDESIYSFTLGLRLLPAFFSFVAHSLCGLLPAS